MVEGNETRTLAYVPENLRTEQMNGCPGDIIIRIDWNEDTIRARTSTLGTLIGVRAASNTIRQQIFQGLSILYGDNVLATDVSFNVVDGNLVVRSDLVHFWVPEEVYLEVTSTEN